MSMIVSAASTMVLLFFFDDFLVLAPGGLVHIALLGMGTLQGVVLPLWWWWQDRRMTRVFEGNLQPSEPTREPTRFALKELLFTCIKFLTLIFFAYPVLGIIILLVTENLGVVSVRRGGPPVWTVWGVLAIVLILSAGFIVFKHVRRSTLLRLEEGEPSYQLSPTNEQAPENGVKLSNQR
jgi:hypothetical protein